MTNRAPTSPDLFVAIEASRLGPAQKAALRLIVEGRSYREAARVAGLRSTADLKRYAERFGLVEAHKRARTALVTREAELKTASVIAELRQVAGKGARELLRRLAEEPESIQTRDLTVLTGVALDKLAKWEKWDGGDEDEDRQKRLSQMLDRLSQFSGKVTLGLQRPDPVGHAITVAPNRFERG